MYGFDVQVRYALGYRQLGEGYFDLRTLYYFRERLSRYMQESGINLLDKAFEQVTDEQITAYHLKTGKQRMDSTQIASNIRTMSRLQLLEEALPNLKERTELETLFTDGGYGSPEADQIMQDNKVEQIQSAIRGRVPSSEKLNLADFEVKQTKTGKPTQITCPQGQTVAVHPSNQKKNHVAHFDDKVCQTCPFLQKCPTQKRKRDPRFHLRFSQQQVYMSQRRRRSLIHQQEGRNIRAAVEATVRQVKHPYPASKLPVRGRFRVTCMMIGSAMITNVRRIQRYLQTKTKLENEQMKAQREQECSQEQLSVSFFASLKNIFSNWMAINSDCNLKLGLPN